MRADIVRARTIKHAEAEFSVSSRQYENCPKEFDACATVSVSTGACNVQAYLTPDECDELARHLVTAGATVRNRNRECAVAV